MIELDFEQFKIKKEEEEEKLDFEQFKKEPVFKLEKAPEVEEDWLTKFKRMFEAKPIARIAKAQVSYNISQKTGVPVEEVNKNLDKYSRDLGVRGIPTSEEFLTAMFAFPVTAALISNPITAGIGVAKFMALTEAENYAISKLKKWDYRLGAGVGLKELLPEETNRLTKDLVDVADFLGKGLVIAKTSPKLMKMWQKFSKEVITTSSPAQQMYVSAKKIKASGLSEAQVKQFFGLNSKQYNEAVKKGIDLQLPAMKAIEIVDTPAWAKIKGLLSIKPYSKTVMATGGKISPVKPILEGKVKVPIKPKVPEVVAKPVPIPKTKAEIAAAEKYGIPLEKVKITEVPKEPEAEAISRLIAEPKPTEEDLEFIEKGFTTLSREELIAKLKAEVPPKVPEKLITPEGVVTGEAGAVFVPTMAEVQNIGTKLKSLVNIEAPFIKAGAKETGFQVKNYYSNIGLAHEQGLKEINFMNKTGFKPVTVTESGFKASGELDYTDLTYLSERPGYFAKLTPEERKMASPAKKAYKDFVETWFKKIKEIGWLEEPFPKSLITRNNRKIGNMKASLPRLKTPEARAKVKAEIKKLQDQNDRIKKQKIQFVSIPAKAILAKADTDPAMHAKIMSILPHWGRTTITVKDLVDAKIITRKEADIRNIIGEYSDRMGRKNALGLIFENAEKEGLIKSAAEKPDWPTARIFIKGQHVSIPQLRGKRLDPFFSDVITDFFSAGEPILGGVWGGIKMMQFHNPVFMPMYDVQESAAAGLIRTIKAPKYIAQGIKDSLLKTDNWARGYENGLFSKPFVIPYDKWENQFTNAMKDNKMGEFLKKAALPTNWIPMLYHASWHTAWKLDETVRLMTFNMLQDQGHGDRGAGQLAALYHSDYASVPPKTRKQMNKLLFTPTFKITMGKLYTEMLKSIASVLTKGKNATQREKNLTKGALTALAILLGRKLYMQSKGFKETELFRKYVKMTETDEGPKEDVVTFSDPFNIPWRYYYRVKNAFKPQTTNVAEKLLQTAKWDLHPVWRVATDVVSNYNWNVYNPYDDSKTIAKDVGFYVFGQFVAITKSLLESAKEGEIKADAFKALQKDFGKFEGIILKPFVFNYLREPMARRKQWALNKLRNDFRRMMLVAPSKDPKVNYERLQNYNKRLQEIQKYFK